MATRRSSFEKRERDKNKKARAAAKREKRFDKSDDPEDGEEAEETAAPTPVGDQQAIFSALEALHAAYDDGRVSLDDFDEQRAELLGRLEV